jgi:hypothetical protein
MTVKTRTSYYVTHDGHEFETPCQPEDGTELVAIVGDRALVSYLSPDHDGTGTWYFDDNDQGQFINFNPRHVGYKKLSEEELKELLEKNKGRAFIINCYEHGLVRYYRQSDSKTSATIPDQQWDVAHGCALYIAPDDAPKPEEYCDSVMEEYTNWYNGDIHGVCHATYTFKNTTGHKALPTQNSVGEGEWELDDESEECWNYIGFDNAKQELADGHAHQLKGLQK